MSEIRTVASLAVLYATRMLGLFMALPVLLVFGQDYEGASPFLLGLALGVYGLTQAIFQIPLGWASDVYGRKPIIIGGLVVFALGSVLAASADNVVLLIVGRALQGSGAIASAIMAMVADLTSEQNRSKAMAAIGASIGLSFSVAMMLGPVVAALFGLAGIFVLSAVLSCLGILIVVFLVPSPKNQFLHRDVAMSPQFIGRLLAHRELLRLDFGIFVLHAVLMAVFVCMPLTLSNDFNLDRARHWQVYLPLLVIAFALMLPFMIAGEKFGKVKLVFVAAVGGLTLACGLMSAINITHCWGFLAIMLLFFVAFNLLEAQLPSLVSKVAPAGAKGSAMGIYSTSQFLGAFVGGTLGGGLFELGGASLVYTVAAIGLGCWVVVASFMRPPKPLMRLCVTALPGIEIAELENMPGVAEAYVDSEAGLLYLKVDRTSFDERLLERFSVA